MELPKSREIRAFEDYIKNRGADNLSNIVKKARIYQENVAIGSAEFQYFEGVLFFISMYRGQNKDCKDENKGKKENYNFSFVEIKRNLREELGREISAEELRGYIEGKGITWEGKTKGRKYFFSDNQYSELVEYFRGNVETSGLLRTQTPCFNPEESKQNLKVAPRGENSESREKKDAEIKKRYKLINREINKSVENTSQPKNMGEGFRTIQIIKNLEERLNKEISGREFRDYIEKNGIKHIGDTRWRRYFFTDEEYSKLVEYFKILEDRPKERGIKPKLSNKDECSKRKNLTSRLIGNNKTRKKWETEILRIKGLEEGKLVDYQLASLEESEFPKEGAFALRPIQILKINNLSGYRAIIKRAERLGINIKRIKEGETWFIFDNFERYLQLKNALSIKRYMADNEKTKEGFLIKKENLDSAYIDKLEIDCLPEGRFYMTAGQIGKMMKLAPNKVKNNLNRIGNTRLTFEGGGRAKWYLIDKKTLEEIRAGKIKKEIKDPLEGYCLEDIVQQAGFPKPNNWEIAEACNSLGILIPENERMPIGKEEGEDLLIKLKESRKKSEVN